MKSPGECTIEGLFEGRPEAYYLFNVVRKYIESIGTVRIEATKTQVSFSTATKFAWVWLPQMWIKKRLKNSITLTFAAGRHIEDSAIEKAVEPYPGRWTHHVIIENESHLDEKVRRMAT